MDIYFKERALNKILLEGASPETFRSLDGEITQASYTKDFSSSYSPYMGMMAYFEGRYYVSDNYAWYLVAQEEYENRNIVALGAVNVPQLRNFSMPNDDRSGYVSDGARVFYLGQEFEGADVQNLRSLDRDYATDLTNVYFHTKRMPGADFASFKIDRVGNSNSHYSYDKNNLYFMQNRIGTSEGYEQISWRYRKNKDKVFYHYHACEGDWYGTHSEVEGADPESFDIFLKEVDQNYDYPEQPYIPYDKNYVYREDKPVFGSDPQSLKPLNISEYIGAQDDNNNRYQFIRGLSSCS